MFSLKVFVTIFCVLRPTMPKQHITEEKMALHMSRLHISTQTPSSSTEEAPARERRLYLCDEMRKLQAENIIPAQLMQKPCTALIPWTPPIGKNLTQFYRVVDFYSTMRIFKTCKENITNVRICYRSLEAK